MSDQASAKSAQKAASQPIELATNNSSHSAAVQAAPAHSAGNSVEEMPTVTSLLRRKKLSARKSSPTSNQNPTILKFPTAPVSPSADTAHPVIQPEGDAADAKTRRRVSRVIEVENPSATPTQPSGAGDVGTPLHRMQINGTSKTPPPFQSQLVLEPLDLVELKKSLKKHKRSIDMKKLDILGYFSRFFPELSYFTMGPTGPIATLGYGTPKLVTQLPKKTLSTQNAPSILTAASSGEPLVTSIEGLRAEDQSGLQALGFEQTHFVAAFPVQHKKFLIGVFLCCAHTPVDFPEKEIKELKKLLDGIEL